MIAAQVHALVHRGPDEAGTLIDDDFGFAMRRLAIVAVAGNHQPVRSPCGRFALIFNGEIYNFPELRAELAGYGFAFPNGGDAEVVLAAWLQWREGAWARLDGMFAIALWDTLDRVLTLVRDPVGIKPLYYTDQRAGFAFASELKALWVVPGLAFEVDPAALNGYFSYGHVRGPGSIYRYVAVVPPGHALTVGERGAPVLRAYDRPVFAPEHGRSREDWVELFRTTWLATVAGQMIADVELGAFLSGGVDSSAVVAAMRRHSERPVKTFAIGFADPRFDESAHAAAVARHLGCDHVSRTVDLTDATDVLPTIQRCYDEPFADPAAVPTWHLSRLAADHVKVALSGDGGDELFYGYRRHRTERAIGRLPGVLRGAAHALGPLGPQRWRSTAASAGRRDGVARLLVKTRVADAPTLLALLAPTLRLTDGPDAIGDAGRAHFPDARAISADSLDQFALADLTINLPPAMLTKVDRASMAHSLEVRVPMLGRAMVALAMTMPADVKLNRGVGKDVVRRAIAPWLPDAITMRPKQGFRMPLGAWFKGDFGRYAESLWHDSGAAGDGHLVPRAVTALFAEHRRGRRDHGRLLYTIAMYCLWRDAERVRRAS